MLVLENVTMEDDGWYTCLVGNSIGVSHAYFWLTVTPRTSSHRPRSVIVVIFYLREILVSCHDRVTRNVSVWITVNKTHRLTLSKYTSETETVYRINRKKRKSI